MNAYGCNTWVLDDDVTYVMIEQRILEHEPHDKRQQKRATANNAAHISIKASDVLEIDVYIDDREDERPCAVESNAIVNEQSLNEDFTSYSILYLLLRFAFQFR